MRLLCLKDHGTPHLTEFLHEPPSYAILSHTWGNDEVTFKDIQEGTAKTKAGYDKIRFCGKTAASHGLDFFWVDTCCIDKSNSTELQEAINSMYRWYRDATRCYVYLSDVSVLNGNESNFSSPPLWQSAFLASRWFTRGWTLQELLAPTSVEFFSQDGQRIGDKRSLEQQIHKRTGIAIQALNGTPLCEFSVDERFKWAETRKTTREEDWAYSLFGIFDIDMRLSYGEGREKAVARLKRKIDKNLKQKDAYHCPEGRSSMPILMVPSMLMLMKLLSQLGSYHLNKTADLLAVCLNWLHLKKCCPKMELSRLPSQGLGELVRHSLHLCWYIAQGPSIKIAQSSGCQHPIWRAWSRHTSTLPNIST